MAVERTSDPSSKIWPDALESANNHDFFLYPWSSSRHIPSCLLFDHQSTCNPIRARAAIGHISRNRFSLPSQGLISCHFSHSIHSMPLVFNEISVGRGSMDGLDVRCSRQSLGASESSILAWPSHLDSHCRHNLVSGHAPKLTSLSYSF